MSGGHCLDWESIESVVEYYCILYGWIVRIMKEVIIIVEMIRDQRCGVNKLSELGVCSSTYPIEF